MRKHNVMRAKKRAKALQAETAAPNTRTWMYHAEHEPRIFETKEAATEAEADGWKDSPAKCDGFLDKIGVDPDNKLQVQYVGEVAEHTAETLNLLENIDTLEKAGLVRLAQLRFSEDWSGKRLGADKMREAITARIVKERQANESSTDT